jgi:hypothetical protein
MSTDSAPKLPAPLRTVSDFVGDHPNTEMHGFGLLMIALMAVLLLPLLPIFAVVWLVSKGIDAVRRTVGGDDDERPGRRPAA